MKDTNVLVRNEWTRGNNYVYSSVNDFNHHVSKTTETGLKYVLKGEENYVLHNKTYVVEAGNCLVINEEQVFDIRVKKCKSPSEGLCLNLDNTLLNDVYAGSVFNHEKLLDNGCDIPGNKFIFFEAVYPASDVLCRYIETLAKQLNKQTGTLVLPGEELFFGLAQNLLLSQSAIQKQALQIKASKHSTRMELYKRISHAKQRLEDEPESRVQIADLAADAALSEFHFFRIFKQAFGISPYQYQIRKRLEKAKSLLTGSNKSINEVAYLAGFADVQSFCKTFKKSFSVSPGKYKGDSKVKSPL